MTIVILSRIKKERRQPLTFNESLITKKVIAYALKDLLKTKSYQKISIKDIMVHAEYRRQTFYSHFTCKNDLTSWIMIQDLLEVSSHNINNEPWELSIKRILMYFKKNNSFYHQALLYTPFFPVLLTNSIKPLITHSMPTEIELSQEAIDFLTSAIVGTIILWMIDDCKRSEDDLAKSLITQLYMFNKKNNQSSFI